MGDCEEKMAKLYHLMPTSLLILIVLDDLMGGIVMR